MSCLPLFSFSRSIPAAFRSFDDSSVSKPDEPRPSAPSDALGTTNAPPESLYDKLSQVSVSHKRVDSFEWVITQSAPNTPPTLDGASFKPYSPLPQRLVSSAPLPVPNENWSIGPKPMREKRQRGYFDWWSSPSLDNGNGYAMIPDDEEYNDRHASTVGSRFEGPSRSHGTEGRTSKASRLLPCSKDCDKPRLSQELNALRIVFPDTPPSTPPTSEVLDTPQPQVARNASPRISRPRLPKRVTFSPVIHEVTLESFPDLNEQRSSPWGSYLPSSFVVARPPLPRTASWPAAKAKTHIRPILRRSPPSETQSTRTTEMVQLSPRMEVDLTTPTASPLPVQRLPGSQSSISGDLGRELSDVDKEVVILLHAAHKRPRRRCDSVLTDASSSYGCECPPL